MELFAKASWKTVAAFAVAVVIMAVVVGIVSTSEMRKAQVEASQLQTELDEARDEIARLNKSLAEVLDQTSALQKVLLDNAREIRRLRAVISCLAMEDTINLTEEPDGTFILKSAVYPHVEFSPDYDPLGGL